MNTQLNQSATTPRVQLPFFRLPVEVQHCKYSEPVAVYNESPIFSSGHLFSATKQAFLDMANSPIINLDDFEDSTNFDDSDPEILLSDSEDEDEDLMHMQNDSEEDAETAIDSDDLNEEECTDGMDVFEETDCQNVIFESSDLPVNQNIPRSYTHMRPAQMELNTFSGKAAPVHNQPARSSIESVQS
jgi:hypothetical protein